MPRRPCAASVAIFELSGTTRRIDPNRLELKVCERCGDNFTRKIGSGRRDCPKCLDQPLPMDERPQTVSLSYLIQLLREHKDEVEPDPRPAAPISPIRHRRPIIDPHKAPWPGYEYKPNRFETA
jgi:hypothetical protein